MTKGTLRVVIAAAVLLACGLSAWATDYVDVVYLKNGSIIRGIIVEQIPDVSIKIKTADGSLFVFKMSEIEKITKEEVAGTAAAAAGSSAAPAEPARPMAAMNLLLDPLGFLQFGPVAQLEFQFFPGLYGYVHARLNGLGLLPWLLYSSSPAIYSFAVGPGVRYFFLSKDSPHAPFLGFLTEIGYTPYSANTGYTDALEGTAINLTFGANAGYRWRFGTLIVQVGAYAGASPRMSSVWHYLSTPTDQHTDPADVVFFGMLDVSIGWEM
jgi:hypothetical protein